MEPAKAIIRRRKQPFMSARSGQSLTAEVVEGPVDLRLLCTIKVMYWIGA
jgi:hypothetical protein